MTEEPAHPRGSAPFPEVRWTNRQELWDLMCKKERGMYLRQSADDILARHPSFQKGMRSILLDWLIEVSSVYRLHRETFYLATDFFDRFLGVTTSIPKERIQLVGELSFASPRKSPSANCPCTNYRWYCQKYRKDRYWNGIVRVEYRS